MVLMNRIFRSASSRLAALVFAMFVVFSQISRLALFAAAFRDLTWDSSIAGIFACGLFFDGMAGLFAVIPWIIFGALMPGKFLKSRGGRTLTVAGLVVFSALMLFITASEWFFWREFGARFNFIAVDYLIWTQEVLGNIAESYPMVPILSGIGMIAGIGVWGLARAGVLNWAVNGAASWKRRIAWLAAGLALPAFATAYVSQAAAPSFSNQYHAELAKNGCWSFFAAFRQMELEYDKWYVKLPDEQLRAGVNKLLGQQVATAHPSEDVPLRRTIAARGPENRWNVILVCMESMSGSFMERMGGADGITPNLDRLANDSIFFENLYATGTRTVRGMEAITLGIPPTPGQAVIYRPAGTHLVTSFVPFLERGYDCAFFYGGDGRFDFMNRYFSTAGCRIMDAGAWNERDVTFKTAWGACDEDLFRKTLAEADADHAAGKPFHFFCMTTSNHRPYDFPEGRIDLPSHSGRKAAVKYADWAVGQFIEEASRKPWFKDTLFVMVADHCASSAGKSEIDVTKYRIPALIHNPSLVPARRIGQLASQIDVMPTVLGLLGWPHEYRGYGNDLLDPAKMDAAGRAFVSNYQSLGLLTHDGIAILKPNRQVSAHSCDLVTGDFGPLDPSRREALVHDATVYYQSASRLFESGGLRLEKTGPSAGGK